MLDELTAPLPGQVFVPAAHRFAPNASRAPLREEFNDRELRILQRLDGAGATGANNAANTGNGAA